MRDFSQDESVTEYYASGKTVACKFTGAFKRVGEIKIVVRSGFMDMHTRVSINDVPMFTFSFWHPHKGSTVGIDGEKIILTDVEVDSRYTLNGGVKV